MKEFISKVILKSFYYNKCYYCERSCVSVRATNFIVLTFRGSNPIIISSCRTCAVSSPSYFISGNTFYMAVERFCFEADEFFMALKFKNKLPKYDFFT